MAKSNALEDSILNHVYRTSTFTKPTALWIALYTADPTDADAGTEVTGGSYARIAVPPLDANWDLPVNDAGGQKTANTGVITFDAPTADWGQITHFGVRSLVTGGVLHHHGALTTPKTVNNGDPAPTFPAGAITIKES